LVERLKDKTIFLQNGEKMKKTQFLRPLLFSIPINKPEKRVGSDVIKYAGL